MSVSVERESPDLIKLQVAGRVTSREWHAALGDVAKLLNPPGQTSVLVAAERFDGWEPGDWDNLSFQENYDAQIGRLAIVAEPKWQDQVLMFAGKGLRKVEMEFFPSSDIQRARQWLASTP